jgi:hypothetical protein
VSRSTSPSRNEFARNVARNAARTSPPQRLIASSTSVSKSGAELSASVDSSFGAFTGFLRLRHENKKRTLSQWSVGRKKANWPLPQSIEAGRILIKAVSRNPAAAALASAREHRCLMQKSIVVDLLNEEICYVGARDEPACPATRFDQCAICISLRPIGQDYGTHDHPV